jgi:F-type H+-transporting ATPase subunit delta
VLESSVARLYARELFSLAQEAGAGSIDTVSAQLVAVAQALSVPDASQALLAPGTPPARQNAAVDSLAASLTPLLVSFLKLLVVRGRFDGLPQISTAFSAMVDAAQGRVRATVTAAQPISDQDLARVQQALAKATGKTITLSAAVDPSLVGGLTADVGGVLYDGSIKTQLAKLRESLKA